ncbi:conserved hypothetical protein [Histoplasma capsulatum H143]|uniref:Uncharacterized protein n=1 Tax=Ajellomyces capsulatus (strain H143) TaxID=544712 RepID=C6H4A0_AJECH|nr:conserved hypothetical protein [Histoplasma capsulatum H143]
MPRRQQPGTPPGLPPSYGHESEAIDAIFMQEMTPNYISSFLLRFYVLKTFPICYPLKRMLLVFVFITQINLSNSYVLKFKMCHDLYNGAEPRFNTASFLKWRIGKAPMNKIVASVLKRIGDLGDLLDSGYGYEDIIRGVQRSTQYTYEALFGTVYFGPDEKYLFKNLDARVRFQRVRGRFEKLHKVIMSDEPLFIWCQDDFFTSTFPFPVDRECAIYYPISSSPTKATFLGLVGNPTKCAENPIVGNRVFMSIARPENVKMTAIILCPQNYDTRNAADVDEQRLKSLANFEKIKFDNLYPIERNNVSQLHFHFFYPAVTGSNRRASTDGYAPPHFLSILNRSFVLMNRYLSVILFQTTGPVTLPPVAGRQLYGWEAAALLPLIDLEKPLNNPVLFLSANDWSTGTAVPMLPDEYGVTHFYQSVNWAYEALTRHGDPQHPPAMDWTVD